MNHLLSIVPSFIAKRSITKRASKSYTATTLATTLTVFLIGCSNGETAQAELADTVVNTANASAVAHVDADANVDANADSNAEVVAALKANMTASGINQPIDSAVPTSMPGMYWVSASGMPSFFTDEQGKYVIQGQVIELGADDPIDISANLQAKAARTLLAKVNKDDMIIYPALGETKAVIYAFTDADCGYCRKLHSEMPDINDKGVEVRYLAWPRSEQTIPKMEAIWCSDNRNQAMNIAKAGGQVNAASCSNPVSEQVDLGFKLGVSGTPAIFTTSGVNIGGYLPAEHLAQAAINNQ